jgi:hypothetical protein
MALFLTFSVLLIPKAMEFRFYHNLIIMKKLVMLAIVISVLAACNKTVSELPPATQTGANTFGASVNGEFWVPRAFGPITGADILEARFKSPTSLIIQARNYASSPTETEFEIFIKDINGPGTYLLNTTVPYPTFDASYGYFIKRKVTPLNEWITSSTYTGSVTITKLDLVNRIVSGTFEFNALNISNSPEPLTVTSGRFDAKLL